MKSSSLARVVNNTTRKAIIALSIIGQAQMVTPKKLHSVTSSFMFYFTDEEKVSEESDELLTSTKIESSESPSGASSSIESSTSKKVPKKESSHSSSSGCSSKKTLMTNLSVRKSEIDLNAPFLPHDVRRKSL